MILRALALCFALVLLAPLALLPVAANDLSLPLQARQLSNRVSVLDSYGLAVGPFEAGIVPEQMIEGRVERQSWRMDGAAVTTLQVLAPLRDQILAEGYEVVLDCRDLECGGFDFRFATEVIPAPDMHVNIRNYRYLSATRGGNETLSLLVSQAGNATYIQVIHVSPQEKKKLRITPKARPANLGQPSQPDQTEPGQPDQPGVVAQSLDDTGHVVLSDLEFETGSAQLGDGPFASLEQLATFLKANPSYKIALVGHTDSVGSLSKNISLSKLRAESVRERLTGQYAIAPTRIEAEGMGYLAPVASNLTFAGRESNRRVEAILLSE